MININKIIRSCHQKLLRLTPSPQVVAIEKLMGLFLNAHNSFDSKRFLLRHLNTFLPYANQINSDELMPLAFQVHNPQTFLLAQIYLEFLTIFDENICSDAKHYLDILGASPSWHAWLTKASAQMKFNLKLYFQQCSIEQREVVMAQVDNPEIKNILLLSTLSMPDSDQHRESLGVRDAQFEKLSFAFRHLNVFPTVPFQDASVICYKPDEHGVEEYYYYPANSLQKFQISENLLFDSSNLNFIIHYDIPMITIGENDDRTHFIPEHCPALVKQGEQYFIYGRTADNQYRLNSIDQSVMEQHLNRRVDDFSGVLWHEIHSQGFHIPLIAYQDQYPIFKEIQSILDQRFQYNIRYVENPAIPDVQDAAIPNLEDRCIYVFRDEEMHTLSLSLKACSGQELRGIESGIIANENSLTDEHKIALLKYLRDAQLIPYLNSSQQAILDEIDEHLQYAQDASDNHALMLDKNIQHHSKKALILSITWSILSKMGLYTQAGQVFGVFNAIKLFNLLSKHLMPVKKEQILELFVPNNLEQWIVGLPQSLANLANDQSDDMQFGKTLIEKQDWGTWLKYIGLGLLFSNIMHRFGIDSNILFKCINFLNLIDAFRAINQSYQEKNSRQFNNDTLSTSFYLLLLFNMNKPFVELQLLLWSQALVIAQHYKTTDVFQAVEQQNIQKLSFDKSNIQTQIEKFNVSEQQARFLLEKMEDLLELLNRISTTNDSHLVEIITPLESLAYQYLSFVAYRENEYQPFLITLQDESNSHQINGVSRQIVEELDRVRFSRQEMDNRFESFQEAVKAKKQELESTYQEQNIDIDALGWSSEWFYQPSTMISAGLLLASASLVGMYMMEFVLFAGVIALMLEAMVPALILTTAVGVGLVFYGLYQSWEPEDLSVPPTLNAL